MKLVKGWKKAYPETAKALGEVLTQIDDHVDYVIQQGGPQECYCEDCVATMQVFGRLAADMVLAELITMVGAASMVGEAVFDGVVDGQEVRQEMVDEEIDAQVEELIDDLED